MITKIIIDHQEFWALINDQSMSGLGIYVFGTLPESERIGVDIEDIYVDYKIIHKKRKNVFWFQRLGLDKRLES